jgi:hypothetical protein
MPFHLAGISAPLQGESLASWIQRVCQIYDLTLGRFHATFGTTQCADSDLCMTSRDLRRVAGICRLPFSDFRMIENSFCRLATRPDLQALLLFQESGRPLYRFCPECWVDDRIPYLRLEWRFKHWVFCPVHRVPLLEQCPMCKRPLAMHRSVLGGTVMPRPVLSMAYCLHCRADMRLNDMTNELDMLDEEELTLSFEWQRAVVSALLHGDFQINRREEESNMRSLMAFIESAVVANASGQSSQTLGHRKMCSPEEFQWLVNETCDKVNWFESGHPIRMDLARTVLQVWKSIM